MEKRQAKRQKIWEIWRKAFCRILVEVSHRFSCKLQGAGRRGEPTGNHGEPTTRQQLLTIRKRPFHASARISRNGEEPQTARQKFVTITLPPPPPRHHHHHHPPPPTRHSVHFIHNFNRKREARQIKRQLGMQLKRFRDGPFSRLRIDEYHKGRCNKWFVPPGTTATLASPRVGGDSKVIVFFVDNRT